MNRGRKVGQEEHVKQDWDSRVPGPVYQELMSTGHDASVEEEPIKCEICPSLRA